jgi:hypothetical protein
VLSGLSSARKQPFPNLKPISAAPCVFQCHNQQKHKNTRYLQEQAARFLFTFKTKTALLYSHLIETLNKTTLFFKLTSQ